MTDYSAAALRPAARTGALAKTVTTTTRQPPATVTRAGTAATLGATTRQAQTPPQSSTTTYAVAGRALTASATMTRTAAPPGPAHTTAVGTTGSTTTEAPPSQQALLITNQVAGWVRPVASSPVRAAGSTAGMTRSSTVAPLSIAAKQVIGAPAAMAVRVWPVAGYTRAASTVTRGPAVTVARGGDGTTGTGTSAARPVQGLLWPRARAIA